MLVAELAAAGPDDPVAALILVQEAWRGALTAGQTARAEREAPESDLTTVIGRVLRGAAAPAGWVIELYPELGALYVRAPASALARLLADRGVASATVPDQGP